MTFLHLILLILGVVGSIVLADVLGHAGIDTWPIGLLILVLIVVTGWTYSGSLASVTIGLAIGFCLVAGASLVRSISTGRRLRKEDRSARTKEQEERDRREASPRFPWSPRSRR